jgi:uncharacterized membrane-anchored protein YitT (DUF2179 family)
MRLEFEIKRLLLVTLGTIIFVLGIAFFVLPAQLIPGGFTGIATLIQYGLSVLGLNVNIGLVILIVNIPVMILGLKGISKTFVYYSIYSIILQSFLLGLLGENPSLFGEDLLANSTLGGVFIGLGAAIALKSGASLGGMDILTQYLALKLQMSIGYIGLIINTGILVIALLIFDVQIAFYTLLMFAVTNQLVDRIHTAYKRVRLDIITTKAEEIKSILIQNSVRGITILEGIGAYTNQPRNILMMVMQVHEVYDIRKLIVSVDPEAFITMTPVRHLNGKFNRVIMR